MPKTDDNHPVTREDVENIVEEIVGRIVGEALQVVAIQFEQQNQLIERRFDRLERKFDAITARTNSHETRIRLLEQAT